MKKFELSFSDIKKPGFNKQKVSKRTGAPKRNSNKPNKPRSDKNSFIEKIKSKLKGKKFWNKAWKVGLICIGGIFVLTVGVFAYFAKDLPSPDKINARDLPESTKIYDRTGDVLLYEIHGEAKRTLVSLDQVTDYAEKATIAAEDKDFYHHIGFDPRGMLRSVFVNVSTDSRVGGSTITQQFVKNSILTSEKSYIRKIKELILAVEIEFRFSKDEILQMYLNEIPYGSNAYGIEAASETFFGKKASDLTLAEAALLASLPQRPTYFSPYGNHQEELFARKDWILDRMVEEGMITEEEASAAKGQEIVFAERHEGIIAPHFVLYVKDQLAEKYGERFIQEGGLKVYTTLNYDLQLKAEKAVTEGVDNNAGSNASNAALVAMDPETGQILAMQGSKDYFDKENDGNVNVAIRDRQPGSSFKPYAYAAAFNKGYTPDTILFDLETDFGSDYKPRNYDLSQNGPVTMRKALAGSLNIPAVKALYLAGVNTTIDMAKEMGITTLNDPDRYGLSLVLGGGEIKLLDHVSAFGVFANDGVKVEKTSILKIIDRDGKTLEDNENKEGKQVLDAQVARQISDVLSDNQARSYVFGSRSPLVLSDRPVAAKTGTTQEYRDAWTVGYTPGLVAGVWAGNNDNSEMTHGSGGVKVAAPIWNAFMEESLRGTEVQSFEAPEKPAVKKPILAGKMATETTVTICNPSGKLATERCPASNREEKTYSRVHNILYYVDKDNPQGSYPSNPKADPQFEKWEGPVIGWAASKGYVNEDPPKEYDDLHEAKNDPQISIAEPKAGTKIVSSPRTIRVEPSAPLGIKKVEFFLDGALIGSDVGGPYSITYDFTRVENGSHILVARVYDIVGNQSETNMGIEVDIERTPTVSLTSPSGSVNLSKSDFAYSVSASVPSSISVDNVKFYATSIDSGETSLISKVAAKKNQTNFSAAWTYPGKGSYQVYAVVLDDNGKSSSSRKASVTVK